MMENRLDLLTQEQIDWCKKYCDFEWLVKDDGKVYPINQNILFKNKRDIVSFPVFFGNSFSMDCSYCSNLESLIGSPKKIYGYFTCAKCSKLKSLLGAPKEVKGDFYVRQCISLETLEGAPKKVGQYFICWGCKKLKSLCGISSVIEGELNIEGCDSLESIDDLKKTYKIKKIKCAGYQSYAITKFYVILNDIEVFRMWQKSDLTADEFIKEYLGFIEAKKYGI